MDPTEMALSLTGVWTEVLVEVSVDAVVSCPLEGAFVPRPETIASRVTLLQLVILSLLLIVRPPLGALSLMSDPPRTLLQSSYVKSDVDPGCNCVWIAARVLRTNCPRDMRDVSSAT